MHHHFQKCVIQLREVSVARTNDIVQCVCDRAVCGDIAPDGVCISGCVKKK